MDHSQIKGGFNGIGHNRQHGWRTHLYGGRWVGITYSAGIFDNLGFNGQVLQAYWPNPRAP